MKERKKSIEILVSIILAICAVIALFIGGYLFCWNFFEKPLSDRQFELCEQIARDVYAQKGNVIVEVPEDFSVSIDTTTITVNVDSIRYRGNVIARLENGKLVMTRNSENGQAVFLSILMGVMFVCVAAYIFLDDGIKFKKIKKNFVK